MRSKNSTIWQLMDDHNQLLGYLVGTIHLKSELSLVRKREIDDCIRESTIVYNETDIAEMRAVDSMQRMLLPKGLHIRDYLSNSFYTRVNRRLKGNLSLNLDEIGHFYPLLIQNFIQEKMLIDGSHLSLDDYIFQKAKSEDKLVVGLEPYHEQLKIFTDIRLKDQVVMLKRVLSNLSHTRKEMERVSKLYVEEQIHKLYRLTSAQLGKYRKLLIHSRNQIMSDRIMMVVHPEFPQLFAIGAGHLSGEFGLIHLLKKRGLKVSPV